MRARLSVLDPFGAADARRQKTETDRFKTALMRVRIIFGNGGTMVQRTLTVKGTAQTALKPDLMIVSQTVRCSALRCKDAMQESDRRVEEIRDRLVALGFAREALKTTDFYVAPSYENETDERGCVRKKFLGYVCTHALKIEFEADCRRLDEALCAIAYGEADPEISLQFVVKDKEAAKKDLLRRAMEDAKKSAEALAEGAGVRLQGIVSIDYGGASQRVAPVAAYSVGLFAREAAPANLIPDDVEMSDSVTVVWEIS